MIIRRLSPADAPAFRHLRLQALQESPTAFGSSYGEEARQPLAAFQKRLERRADNWVFGSLQGEQLLGVVRLVREQGRKERHKATLYGLYVAPTARKFKGLRQIRVGVVTSNAAASALYVKAGFVAYGQEDDALWVAGRFHAESLLVKKLRKSRAGKAKAQLGR